MKEWFFIKGELVFQLRSYLYLFISENALLTLPGLEDHRTP